MGNSCQNPPQFEVRLSGLTIYLEEFLQVMWAVPVPIYQRPVRVHCSPSPVKFRAPISACPVAFLHPNPARFSGKKRGRHNWQVTFHSCQQNICISIRRDGRMCSGWVCLEGLCPGNRAERWLLHPVPHLKMYGALGVRPLNGAEFN